MAGGGASREEGWIEALVEGGEASSALCGEGEQVEVGQVAGRGEARKDARVGKGQVVGPELVPGGGEETLEEVSHLVRRTCWPDVGGLSQNAEEGVFSERAGGPAIRNSLLLKEAQGGNPLGVIGVAEGDQHVDVEQPDHALPRARASTRESSSSCCCAMSRSMRSADTAAPPLLRLRMPKGPTT